MDELNIINKNISSTINKRNLFKSITKKRLRKTTKLKEKSLIQMQHQQQQQQQQQQKYPQEEQHQQQQQMGFNGDGGGGGGESNNNRGGGGGGGGGGLTRFWSAPSTWLDSLVQDLEIPPSQNHCLPQLPTSTTTPPPPPSPLLRSSNFFDTTTSSTAAGTLLSTSSDLGFLRQNSSPAELLDNLTSSQVLGSDGYLPSFGGDFNYNLSSSSSPLDFPSNKRTRESEFHQDPSKFSPQLKGEPLSGVNSYSDMEMEKLFEDSVPCRVRAKRGCATHPRSIAERVRRTRISDRIRKLQELVPNMDKQTNTADMLEEAVEYVKVLQKQIKELSEHQQNCTCLARS